MHRCSKTQCWETRKVRPYHQCCSYISSVIFFIFQIETLFCRRHTAEHLLKYIKASHSLSPLLLSLAIYLLISLSLSQTKNVQWKLLWVTSTSVSSSSEPSRSTTTSRKSRLSENKSSLPTQKHNIQTDLLTRLNLHIPWCWINKYVI